MIVGNRPKHKKMYNFKPFNDRAKRKKWNKVYCIGLNKTGTTSLHIAFQKLGLKSFHGGTFDSRIDAFSDGRYYKNFEKLYYQTPNSLFILNTRDLKDWIVSRIKHCQKGHYTPGWENDSIHSPKRIKEWVNERWQLYEKINEFFKDKQSRLLVFDVCAGDNYQKLCPFLGLSRIAEKFPRKNQSKEKVNLTPEQTKTIDELVALENINNPFLKNN
jgi:hypothetical protein